jgi:hypothetical protein
MGRNRVISDQISAIRRQEKAYTKIAEDAKFAEKRKRDGRGRGRRRSQREAKKKRRRGRETQEHSQE